MAKTWQQKFDNGRNPAVEILDKDWSDMKAGSRMLISSPGEVDAYVRAIPPGSTVTIKQFRDDLAKGHDADGACPLTTGIFLRIVSELNLDRLAAGEKDVTPF